MLAARGSIMFDVNSTAMRWHRAGAEKALCVPVITPEACLNGTMRPNIISSLRSYRFIIFSMWLFQEYDSKLTLPHQWPALSQRLNYGIRWNNLSLVSSVEVKVQFRYFHVKQHFIQHLAEPMLRLILSWSDVEHPNTRWVYYLVYRRKE